MSEAVIDTPPAEAASAPPGPKEFSVATSRGHESFRAALEAHSEPDPNRPPPKAKEAPPKPAEPKKLDEVKPPEAKAAEKPPEKPADGKPDKLPTGRPPTTKAQETWKSLKSERDEYKRQVDEMRAQRVPDEERNGLTERMTAIQRRNEELENHIRFANYEQSTEFSDKYHKPYVDMLADATHFLERIPVVDPVSQQQRAGNEQDIFALMNMNPVDQAEAAESMFGPRLGQRVVNEVEKVRDKLTARNKALEEAKTKGKEREQQQGEQLKARVEAFKTKVKEWYTAADTEWSKDPEAKLFDTIVREDGKELTPDEVAHNDLVAKGKELASWVSKHPQDAKTPEEAAKIVRKQVALLKRGIHFGPLRRLYKGVVKERDALKKELDGIRSTTPTTTGRQPNGKPAPKGVSGVKGMFNGYAGR